MAQFIHCRSSGSSAAALQVAAAQPQAPLRRVARCSAVLCVSRVLSVLGLCTQPGWPQVGQKLLGEAINSLLLAAGVPKERILSNY